MFSVNNKKNKKMTQGIGKTKFILAKLSNANMVDLYQF